MQPNSIVNIGGVAASVVHADCSYSSSYLLSDCAGLRVRARSTSTSKSKCERYWLCDNVLSPIHTGFVPRICTVRAAQLCAAGKGERNISAIGVFSTTRAKRNHVVS